jgi:hypothetical protein
LSETEDQIHDEMEAEARRIRDPLWPLVNWQGGPILVRFVQLLMGIAMIVFSWWLYKTYDPNHRSWPW